MSICKRQRTEWVGSVECGQPEGHSAHGSDHIGVTEWEGETVIVGWSDRFPDSVDIRFPGRRQDA
jgi:hypothetical protein